MLGEFRSFINRGNVLGLAVGVIIGAAFGTIVSSLTDDIIMPLIGAATGGLDFSSKFVLLGDIPATYAGSPTDYAALKKAGVPMLGWGKFLTTVVSFLLLAFIVFLIVRTAAKVMREEEAAAPPEEVLLLREIRDSLRR
ncbi:large conductance mechanosensitive channel protein MscL [Sphingomonas sp. LHG3406-1]|uniref:large conductance mechanosensitive channel protein MscL n=1 Tax=Sphingomonas sp. LHG3406-1 TaxID=2804617 RepID=UPI002611E546|nr:large conductance mechanosensitive channel protein MscL [Sphingomonas sp. LHG3406-1]